MTIEELAEVAHLLGQPTRLEILRLLTSGESSVGAVAAAVGVSLSAVSQHLSKLRAGGLVAWRRQDQERRYFLAEDLHPLAQRALELAGGAA